jgi:inorganic pyrophosphatase
MSLSNVSAGNNVPAEFNVIVEIPMHSDPIKFEIDKESHAIFVDRFMSTAMRYPCNYGYIPRTLSADGDPADVLVVAPFALQPGVVLACRAVGLMRMEDEHGQDNKVLAVPVDKLTRLYRKVSGPQDLPDVLLEQIAHFFAHYKDLEPGKFAHVGAFESAEAAIEEIMQGVASYQAESLKTPHEDPARSVHTDGRSDLFKPRPLP